MRLQLLVQCRELLYGRHGLLLTSSLNGSVELTGELKPGGALTPLSAFRGFTNQAPLP